MSDNTMAACQALGVDFRAPLRENLDGRWITRKRLATVRDFHAHWRGKKIIGHVCNGFVDVISRDIDAHGMLPGIAEEVIAQRYARCVAAHGMPGVVSRSRDGGGIHPYWFLERPMPFETLQARILDQVPDVEVLPRPRRNGGAGAIIRTPGAWACGGRLLSPFDLKPLPISPGEETENAFIDAARGQRVTIERFLSLSRETASAIFKTGSRRRMRAGLHLASYMERVGQGIVQGKTNDAILAMVRAAVSSRWDVQSTIAFIAERLNASGVELKPDTQGAELDRRVRHLFKTCRESAHARVGTILREGDPSLLTHPTVAEVVNQVVGFFGPGKIKGRRLGALRKVALSLVRSVERLRALNEKELRILDGVFPGTYRKVKVHGLVPLPTTLWRRWAQGRYSWYRQAFMASGVLSPGWDTRNGQHAGYCPGGAGARYRDKGWGTCRYYKANF